MTIEHEMRPIAGLNDIVQVVVTTADLSPAYTMTVEYEANGIAGKSIGLPYQGVPVPAGATITSVEVG